MRALVSRLVAGGAAYQASSLLSAAFALLTLPLYTDALSPADFGVAETLLTFIILSSILLRVGLGEAFVRFYYGVEGDEERDKLARTVTFMVLALSSAGAIAGAILADPLSDLILGFEDGGIMRIALLGMWAFTNLEVAYALLRVEERRRTYLLASMSNVLLTVALTITLVVGLDEGARGYLAGNYAASAAVLVCLWVTLRHRIGVRIEVPLKPLLAFGAPTVPADATVFALNVVDRAYLLRHRDAAAAGLFALSVKLATVVILAVRGFQLAWPPLAYSIDDDDEARRFYAAVTTWFVVIAGLVVAAITLMGRWLVRVFAADEFFEAHEALPWVALGWAMYGLFLVMVTIGGRAGVTTRAFPAALAGVVVNVIALVTLVDPYGIKGAGIALVLAYAVMLVVAYFLMRNLFVVPFEWGRLLHAVTLLAGAAVAGEFLLPESGVDGFASRAAVAVVLPVLLYVSGFLRPGEREALHEIPGRLRARRSAS